LFSKEIIHNLFTGGTGYALQAAQTGSGFNQYFSNQQQFPSGVGFQQQLLSGYNQYFPNQIQQQFPSGFGTNPYYSNQQQLPIGYGFGQYLY
jgi:hypothetical protein